MGIIKKDEIEDKGTFFLEENNIEISKRPLPKLKRLIPQQIRIEQPLSGQMEGKEATAEEDLWQVREQARREGIEEGLEIAKRESKEKFKDALQTLNSAVKERKKIIKDAEAEILRLSLKVAEQIIRSEVSLHRDVCLNMVSEAVGRISDREQVIIKVNREDADTVKKYKDRIVSLLDGVKNFSIVEDSNIEPGGCVIETNLGYVDARIPTKLKSIEESFKNEYKSQQESLREE